MASAFYKAASLVGSARYVDKNPVERVVDHLILEFDTERWYPVEAIAALALMGSVCVPHVVQYMLDNGLDTFSLEDAAQVLGRIGNKSVLDAITENASRLSPRTAKMAVHAIGLSGNPLGVHVIRAIAPRMAVTSQHIVDAALQRLGSPDSAVAAAPAEDAPSEANEQLLSPVMTALRSSAVIEEALALRAAASLQGLGPWSSMKQLGIPRALRRVIDDVRRLRQDQHLREAEIGTSACLDLYPTVPFVYHDLALIFSRQERFTAAKRYYTAALPLSPEYSDWFNDFAVTMMRLGKAEAVRCLLLKAISIDRNNHRPWYNLARLSLGFAPATGKLDSDTGSLPLRTRLIRMFGYIDFERARWHDART